MQVSRGKSESVAFSWSQHYPTLPSLTTHLYVTHCYLKKRAYNYQMTTSLKGKLLIAMPGMVDTTFAESVVFLCAHGPDGAMGIIINKPMAGLNFMELADKLDMSKTSEVTRDHLEQTPVLMGGPVEQHRGFVLHSDDYTEVESSLDVMEGYKLTASLDILQDMALGRGPGRSLLALGYSGWTAGQLENEILHNGWLHCDADVDLVFSPDWHVKHRRAMAKLGVDPGRLSTIAGHS
jgi:putative transcriptional regulator